MGSPKNRFMRAVAMILPLLLCLSITTAAPVEKGLVPSKNVLDFYVDLAAKAKTGPVLRRTGSSSGSTSSGSSSGSNSGSGSSSASSSASSSGSSTTPTAAPTAPTPTSAPAPTAQPTSQPTVGGYNPVTVTQAITMTGVTASGYNGDSNLQAVCNHAYLMAVGCATGASVTAGCSCTSTAARRSTVVTFVAKVPAAQASSAQTAAGSITTTSFSSSLTSAKTALGSAYASVTLPTVASVANPSFAVDSSPNSLSGVSARSASLFTLVAMLLVAALYQ